MQIYKHQKDYSELQMKLDNDLKESVSLCSRITFWRGISFGIAVLLFCLGYQYKNMICYLSAAASLFLFLSLIRYHDKQKQEQQYLTDYLSVVKDYQARFDDKWKDFTVDGAHYLNPAFMEAKDLDIFGSHSLFQYICTASTVWGQDQLADWLGHSGKNIDEIQSRQQAVAELADHPDFSMRFEALARSLRSLTYDTSKKIMQDFFQALTPNSAEACPAKTHTLSQNGADIHPDKLPESKSKTRHPKYTVSKFFIRIFPAATLVFLSAAVLGIHRQTATSCFLLLTTLQLLTSLLTSGYHSKLLAPIYKMNQSITPYRKLIELLEQETFHSSYLHTLQKDLTDHHTASNALKELEQIADSVVMRHNLFALILCNSLFLYDFHCAQKYLKWKTSYQHSFQKWMHVIGKTEALISLGVISRTKETHSLPKLCDLPRPKLSGTEVKHPLIKESAAVGNDVALTHSACIITGSNMSGKTTFMRSIGMNLVLAYAGGYCTAADFHVSIMELCTSMRTQDNVSEGISTFYAELIRIKKMVDVSSRRIPMIALIDEIYKGTNSKDRIYAALETVKALAQPYAFVVITTHDFELCDLENDAQIDAKNYYFSEYYEQNQIRFDYKIKKGRSTTTNARYLLRMAGILK